MIVTWSECASALKTRPVCSSRPMSIGSAPVGSRRSPRASRGRRPRRSRCASTRRRRAGAPRRRRFPPDRGRPGSRRSAATASASRSGTRLRRGRPVLSLAGRAIDREYPRWRAERRVNRCAVDRIGLAVADAVLIYATPSAPRTCGTRCRSACPIRSSTPRRTEAARVRELDGGDPAQRARALRRPRHEELGVDELVESGLEPRELTAQLALRAVASLGPAARHGSRELPGLACGPAPRHRRRARGRPGALRRPPAGEDRGAARGDEARATCGRGGDGRLPRASATFGDPG
jgi:hypothetical protein